MGNIVLLDEHTINKIAAGEVVDRPSSIVKELIENSIDAKAKNITVDIRNGGISYIKITDDGTGIASDDVEIAFERHATSKIRQEEDLRKITTMGFRGEALASIAAISKVTLTTKKAEESIGTKIYVEAGKIKSVEQVASTHGTIIQVNDVFFNVPARYKFLKKDYTEAGYIEDVVIRTALVNPQISFKYINNGKTIVQTNGNNDIKTAIYSIFGKEIYENLLEVNYEYQNIKVVGVIGLPKISRSSRTQQYTYVNSRYIKDKIISTAIDKAYDQQLAINKFAFSVINIELSPENIDVNVHPTKLEVKFSNESQVFESVFHAVKDALEKYNEITNPFTKMKYENPSLIKEVLDKNIKTIDKSVSNKYLSSLSENYENNNQDIRTTENVDVVNDDEIVNDLKISNSSANVDNIKYSEKEEKSSDNKEILKEENVDNNVYEQSEIKIEQSSKVPVYKYIGCVFDTYMIIQMQDKMYLIDQHAAHERYLFEQIKQSYYSKQKEIQMLLVPILIEFTQKEMDIIKQHIEMFKNVGYILEEFSDNTIKISGIPNVGYNVDPKSMFKDIIDELSGSSKTNTENIEWRFLATVACKAAVKGGTKLSDQEHVELINNMLKLERPFTCPHGRPTAFDMSKYEIERKFLRK